MSSRKRRESRQQNPDNAEPSDADDPGSPSGQQSATGSSGTGKSPVKMMIALWGVPLVLFMVIAVFKQCGS